VPVAGMTPGPTLKVRRDRDAIHRDGGRSLHPSSYKPLKAGALRAALQ
jgi:hypothetical protein